MPEHKNDPLAIQLLRAFQAADDDKRRRIVADAFNSLGCSVRCYDTVHDDLVWVDNIGCEDYVGWVGSDEGRWRQMADLVAIEDAADPERIAELLGDEKEAGDGE